MHMMSLYITNAPIQISGPNRPRTIERPNNNGNRSKMRKPGLINLAALSSLVIASLALSACAPRVTVRGNLPRDTELSKVEIGSHNRKQVARILGTPSTRGTFDGNVWYYISRKTEKTAFFEAEIVDQQVIAVYFNDKNVVQAIHRYNKDDKRQVEIVERTTPTAGRKYSIIDQLLGNLGRFGK
jgi:outer membrane protein assembly factor BamE (lipoprotein component of BamABCDE complex)